MWMLQAGPFMQEEVELEAGEARVFHSPRGEPRFQKHACRGRWEGSKVLAERLGFFGQNPFPLIHIDKNMSLGNAGVRDWAVFSYGSG